MNLPNRSRIRTQSSPFFTHSSNAFNSHRRSFVSPVNKTLLPIKSDVSNVAKKSDSEITMYCKVNEIKYPLKYLTSKGNLGHKIDSRMSIFQRLKKRRTTEENAHHIGLGNFSASPPTSVANQRNKLVKNFGSITN